MRNVALINRHPALSLFDELNEFLTHEATPGMNLESEFFENESHFALSMDLPGVKKSDIHLEVKDRVLLVTGERKKRFSKDDEVKSKFERSFRLPESVDAEKIEAHLEDGVLTLAIPKLEKAKPIKISISEGAKEGFLTKLLPSK